jgi:tetratricopeptide (TPR) repeat protein
MLVMGRGTSRPPSPVAPSDGAVLTADEQAHRQAWDARAAEISRLNLADPPSALARAEAWVAAETQTEGRARALKSLAYALRIKGQHERAAESFSEAEAAFEHLGLADEAARCRIGHVDAFRYLGRYDAAIAMAEGNLAYFEAGGEAYALDAARQMVNLSLVYWRQGNLQAALEYSQRVRRIARRIQDRELGATASMNAGLILTELGRYGEALKATRYAARWYRTLGLGERLATVRMNLGLLHIARGEYAQALEELNASRALCEQLGLDQKGVAADLDLATAYLALNLDRESAEAAARAADTLRRLELPFELANALLRGALAAERAGEVAAARASIAEARELFARVGNVVWENVATVHALRLVLAADDVTDPDDVLVAAIATAERLASLGALDHAAAAYLLAGDVEARRGRCESALTSYRAALDIGRRLGADDIQQLAQAACGVVAEASAPDDALTAYGAAVEHLERLRARARADDLKLSVVATGVDLYERIARLLLRNAGAEREAFRWLERGKSRGLLEEAIGASSTTTKQARSSPRIARSRERVAEARARLNRAYDARYTLDAGVAARGAMADTDDLVGLERELRQATRELQILVRPNGAADVSAILDVERVQATLAPEAVLIEYAFLGDELACFVIARDRFELRRGIAARGELEEAAHWFWFHIRKGSYGADYIRANSRTLRPAMDRALGRLGALLLAPLADALDGAEHLVIVPQAFLHTLPFHALTYREGALLDALTVSYAPSAAVLTAAVERGDRRPTRPLIVAPSIPDLPWVGEEAVRVGALFEGATVLTGQRATIKALRRHAAQADALHLATHGVFRADNPTFSALELADGWLTVGELAELSADRALVCLSACHTGMSGIGPGDELLGLTRAVLGVGSRALVASLWAANDDTTPAFMTRFYAGLQAGLSRAASLRAAALATRDAEPHPYFWAPFNLVGAP